MGQGTTGRKQARAALDAALSRRRSLLAEGQLSAFRLIHAEADGCPGLTVDRCGPALLVEQHQREVEAEPMIAALLDRFGRSTPLVLKRRWSREERARAGEQINGEPLDLELVVEEEGLRFVLRLLEGEHTGLFLDGRRARRLVRQRSAGLRVLNLFSYTAAFGVAAAAGGARSTTNVDNKRSAHQRGRQNYALNDDLPVDTRTFLKSDVVPFLNRAARGSGRYDLVIVDPPPRYRRRGQRGFDAREGYGRLLARCLRVLAPGGLLLAGLNAPGSVSEASFQLALAEASESAELDLRLEERIGPDPDFPEGARRPTARFILARAGALP